MAVEQQKNLTDCYWFLNRQCKKGEACEYRHSEGALENLTVCKFWVEGKCANVNCMFRHPSGVQGKQDRSQTQCFYFSQGKCTKGDSCPFSHAVGGSQDQNLEKQKEKEEAELRKLQLARKKEEERLAKLKAQGEELERRNQLKRRNEEQAQQQKPASKLEKKVERAAPQERQPGVGTFVKSLDQILKKDEKPKTKAAKQQVASELKKPQKKAAPAEKKASAAEKKQAPEKKRKANAAEKATQEPSGPVNFGIKTLDQILKEKAAGGGGVRVEENQEKAAPSRPAKAKKTPEQATNSGSYLDELRKKNQQKFGQPAPSVEKADPEPEPEARGNTSPKRKKIEEPLAQKTETKKQKVEQQPPAAANAGNLKKSMSMDEFDKELDEFANMDGVSATATTEMTEMASDDDFDKEFNELQDLIK